ncbi:tyrosine-type recombinase/integrase [Sphingorhabdus sp. EL138]|uniref:tyrosine-type recombinase/integrase n=1 Tax=Sphingorhabdus sp. EL138 TaxID=2073156 RepID=UPI0020B13BC8|nr:tyrosine-type recombinase/integrase [Sphingorhabdus sp. EL138]
MTDPIDATQVPETTNNHAMQLIGDIRFAAPPHTNIDWDLLNAFVAQCPANTLRALRNDFETFDLWCRRSSLPALPSEPATIAAYLNHRAEQGAKTASLSRYVASIAKIHRLLDLSDPTKNETVRLTLYGLRRKNGSVQNQAKALRFKGDVKNVLRDKPRGIAIKQLLEACGDNLIGLRNRALLSVAYDTGLRRSELVAVQLDDIMPALDADARLLNISRTKGDQIGEGATAYLSPRSVKAIEAWTQAGEIKTGPLFRRVRVWHRKAKPAHPGINMRDLSGRAIWDQRKRYPKAAVPTRTTYRVGDEALHPGSIPPIFKRAVQDTFDRGLLPDFDKNSIKDAVAAISSHSTRVGLTQDLFSVGEDIGAIMDALRWQSEKMPLRYNRKLAAEAGAAGRLLGQLR